MLYWIYDFLVNLSVCLFVFSFVHLFNVSSSFNLKIALKDIDDLSLQLETLKKKIEEKEQELAKSDKLAGIWHNPDEILCHPSHKFSFIVLTFKHNRGTKKLAGNNDKRTRSQEKWSQCDER